MNVVNAVRLCALLAERGIPRIERVAYDAEAVACEVAAAGLPAETEKLLVAARAGRDATFYAAEP